MKRQEKGITLVALVVTIIVLLILAGVAINMVLGENGLIQKAKVAQEKYAVAEEKEKIQMAYAAYLMGNLDGEFDAEALKAKVKEQAPDAEVTVSEDGKSVTVTYPETGNSYTIDSNGNVTEKDTLTNGAETVPEIPNTYANMETGTSFRTDVENLNGGELKLITSVKFAKSAPATGVTTADVSAEKNGSILAWMDNGTLYIYSEAGHLTLAQDSQSLFMSFENATSIDISRFDFSHVKIFDNMFGGCQSLLSLDLRNVDTSSAESMHGMFGGMWVITSLDLSSFDTSKVTNMFAMFAADMKLKNLNLSSFDTSNVTNMFNMFAGNKEIQTIDISSFDTTKVTNMSSMFVDCPELSTIYVSNKWNVSNVTNSNAMFQNDTKLPHFTASTIDKTNANTSATGYLTLKQ